ncbi:MAG: MATE family efflux transporter [Anaerovoracaceae bacterium]
MTKLMEKELFKKFMHYVVPSVVAMWVFTIYTMVDGMFVARGVGPSALAAVNIAMPFINFTFALGILFAVGASTVASIHKGKGEMQKANEVFTLSTITVFVVALVLTVVALLNLDFLAEMLGATDATREYVKDYLGVIILFDVFYMTAYNLEVLTKADGFPHIAIMTTSAGAVCNIVLDYFFVIVFQWGIAGAAWATGISQLLTFTIFLLRFLSKGSNFNFVKVKFQFARVAKLARIGSADSVTEFSVGAVIFMFNNTIIRVIGDDGVVIYTVIAYVSQLILMTMMGLNQGMQPLVSYYHGKEEKIIHKYILKMALMCAVICSLVAFLIGIIYPNPVVAAFIDSGKNPELFESAISAFKLFSFSFLPLGVVVILAGYCTALEKAKYAFTISICRGLIFVSISLVLMSILFGATGIWLSMAVSEGIALILAVYIYKNILVLKE